LLPFLLDRRRSRVRPYGIFLTPPSGHGTQRRTDNTRLSEFLQPTPIRISEACVVFSYGPPSSSGESQARTYDESIPVGLVIRNYFKV